MDTEAIERINAFLSNYGKSFDTLTKNQKDKFLLIDNAIQQRLTKINEAKEVIAKNSINTMNISHDTGILRPTFYQQPLFDAFVKSYKSEEPGTSQPSRQNPSDKTEQLNKQIELFMKRDIDWASKLAKAEEKYDSVMESVSEAIQRLSGIEEYETKTLLENRINKAINILKKHFGSDSSVHENWT